MSEVKLRLGYYPRKVKGGASIIVTARGKAAAILIPSYERLETKVGKELELKGIGSWKGGKPKGTSRLIKVKGTPVSKIVLEERR